MKIRNSALKLTMGALCVVSAGCAAETGSTEDAVGHSADALGTSSISAHAPDGIVYSTGNIYFTTHAGIRVSPPPPTSGPVRAPTAIDPLPPLQIASVMRTGRSSLPGQEITLWSERGSRFGDIVWALVGGEYFGYFLSQNLTNHVVTIKRVPLAGGTAIDIAGGIGSDIDIVNGHHLLDTDGTSLFWQDATGIHKMPIGGGTHTLLDTTPPNTPTAGIHVVGTSVVYATSNQLIYVPTAGTFTSPAFRTIVTASSRITTTDSVMYGTAPMYAWGSQDGSATFELTGTKLGIKALGGRIPTSLAQSGGESFGYTACASNGCEVSVGQLGTQTVASGAFGLDVQFSSAATSSLIEAYWADSAGIHRNSGYYIP